MKTELNEFAAAIQGVLTEKMKLDVNVMIVVWTGDVGEEALTNYIATGDDPMPALATFLASDFAIQDQAIYGEAVLGILDTAYEYLPIDEHTPVALLFYKDGTPKRYGSKERAQKVGVACASTTLPAGSPQPSSRIIQPIKYHGIYLYLFYTGHRVGDLRRHFGQDR